MKRIPFCLLALILIAISFLSGCGGGNSPTSIDNGTSDSIETTIASISFDPSVPQKDIDSISQLISPLSIGTLQSGIEVPVLSDGEETVVLAINNNDKIVLGGIINSTELVVLSAETTALALVRLVIGSQSINHISSNDLNMKIKSTNEFSNLISLVKRENNDESSGSLSDNTYKSILTILSQISDGSTTKASKLSQDNQYLIHGYLTGVRMKGSNNVGGILVNNMSAINWSIYSSDPDDATMKTDDVQLESMSSLKDLVYPTDISVDGIGKSFNVTVCQSSVSHYANVFGCITSLITTALDFAHMVDLGRGCIPSAVEALIGDGTSLPAWASQPTFETTLNYLKSQLSNKEVIAKAIATCAKQYEGSKFFSVLYNLVKDIAVKEIADPNFFSAMGTAIDATFMATKLGETLATWNDSATTHICLDNEYQLTTCDDIVDHIEVTPSLPGVKIGDTLTVKAKEYNKNNVEISKDYSFKWYSKFPSYATVDINSGLITGHRIGTAYFTVVDSTNNAIYKDFSAYVYPRSIDIKISAYPSSDPPYYVTDLLYFSAFGKNSDGSERQLFNNIDDLKWRSSNPLVAKINDSGILEAIGPGTSKISASLDNYGISADYDLTINPKVLMIVLSSPDKVSEFKKGQQFQIIATAYSDYNKNIVIPTVATDYNWSIQPGLHETIDENGLLTIDDLSWWVNCNITATYKNSSVSKSAFLGSLVLTQ